MTSQSRSVGLIVLADEPALFFSSVKAAESYLEAIDVDNGVYPQAFGPKGEIYTLRSVDGKVIIEPNNENASEPRILEDILRSVLLMRGVCIPTNASLGDLLRQCERYVDDW